jgi:hypothetical protein
MIRLYKYDNPSEYNVFPDFVFSRDDILLQFDLNKVTIDGIDYRLSEQDFDTRTWPRSAGDYVEYEYYQGIEAGNPSGAKNIKLIRYYNKYANLIKS